MRSDIKWIGGLVALLGVYLLLNCLILSEAPSRILYHNLIVSVILVVSGLAYGMGKGLSILPWFFFGLGAYLQVAPVLLWAPQAVQFLNMSAVGFLTAAIGGLIPFAEADALHNAPSRPLGWSYNPSAWSQRLLVFVCCVICLAASSYLAAFQLGYIQHIWDPIFGDEGSLRVITSKLSQSFPVSDAGMGAALYAIEALCVWKGGASRWYTNPAFVLFFGLLVIPVGSVSILLIISQPLVVGHWCFWCLLTAAAMLCMIALAIDEVVAAIQFLMRVKKSNPEKFWQTFWHGGKPTYANIEKNRELEQNISLSSLVRGVSPTIPLMGSLFVGAWLMVAPTIRGSTNNVGHVEDCIGPLVIAVSMIAMAEVARPVRYLNLGLGMILFFALFLAGSTRFEQAEVLLAGLLLMFFNLPKTWMRPKIV